MKVFWIGIGIYPFKCKKNLFDTFIYSTNPENLLKALSVISGKSIKTENELKIPDEKGINGELQKLYEEFLKNEKFVLKI